MNYKMYVRQKLVPKYAEIRIKDRKNKSDERLKTRTCVWLICSAATWVLAVQHECTLNAVTLTKHVQ
jgi:hypothetical protein